MADFQLKPIKDEVSYADFAKIDIRVGRIEQVIDLPTSDTLVKLLVDFGDHQRTIIVGLKQERKDPQEIEGLQALFVVNLPPKEMFDEISEGMLFDLGYDNKIIPVLAVPEKPVPNGASAG